MNARATTNPDWRWYYGVAEHAEYYTGEFATRDEAIEAGKDAYAGDGELDDEDGRWKLSFYVSEARKEALRLADWIDADRLLERAAENFVDSDRAGEGDEGDVFTCTPEQENDLHDRVVRACDEWQAEHGIVYIPWLFAEMRSGEGIEVDVTDERAPGEAARESGTGAP